MAEAVDIDEFALLPENAAEVGLPWTSPPSVRRQAVDLPDGRQVSALVWGDEPAELVLIHGGGQNAHTWDSVALLLARPLVAIDLPGHGHSSWRSDGVYERPLIADDVAVAVAALAPDARAVVGMSLGATTAISLAARHPELVRRLGLVDATPGGTGEGARAIGEFIRGPESFASLDEILERTIAFNPTRSRSSLRRGVIHNSRRRDDGRWVWRHHVGNDPTVQISRRPDDDAWEEVDRLRVPILLVLGGLSTVVIPANVEEFRRRQPDLQVEVVEGAGHSVQGDRPVELARLLADFVDG
jgi:pimeloyl-ACP methyl ester carboxylesterase